MDSKIVPRADPKVITPNASRETINPVSPSLLYSIDPPAHGPYAKTSLLRRRKPDRTAYIFLKHRKCKTNA
jgi:hypothetical protein